MIHWRDDAEPPSISIDPRYDPRSPTLVGPFWNTGVVDAPDELAAESRVRSAVARPACLGNDTGQTAYYDTAIEPRDGDHVLVMRPGKRFVAKYFYNIGGVPFLVSHWALCPIESIDPPVRFATRVLSVRFPARLFMYIPDHQRMMPNEMEARQRNAVQHRFPIEWLIRSDLGRRVDARLELIRDGRTWRPLHEGPLCVLHLIPIASMSGRTNVDILAAYKDGFVQFSEPDWGGASRTLNLDGLVAHPGMRKDEPTITHVQIFRSGVLEAVRYAGRLIDDAKIIPSTTISKYFRDTIRRLTVATQRFGIAGPAMLGAALLRTDGYSFGVGRGFPDPVRAPADRSDLVVPEIVLERVEAAEDIDAMAKPLLDILWQSFDIERCYEYDEAGNWRPGR